MSSEQAVAPRIRHCPLCDSDKSQTILKLSPAPLGDRFCDSEEEARACGRVILGYGASHSTTTLIYSLGIESLLDFIVGDNTAKHDFFHQGRRYRLKIAELSTIISLHF